MNGKNACHAGRRESALDSSPLIAQISPVLQTKKLVLRYADESHGSKQEVFGTFLFPFPFWHQRQRRELVIMF